MIYIEKVQLNITRIEGLTVYVAAGFSKSSAESYEETTVPAVFDLKTFFKNFIIAVPIEGATHTYLEYKAYMVGEETIADHHYEVRWIISLVVTFCTLILFFAVIGIYILVKFVRDKWQKRAKISVDPGRKDNYDLTK